MISVDHIAGATPSRGGLQQLIAREFGSDVEKVDIKNIFSSIGKQQSRAKVFIWDEKRKVQSTPKSTGAEGAEQSGVSGMEDLTKAKPKEEKAEEKSVEQKRESEAK